MGKIKILQEGQCYTFRSYFELPYEPEDILGEFGYSFVQRKLTLAEWQEEQEIFYGAVSMGEVWRFGELNRQQQSITQDLELFKIPADLEQLIKIILGIITKD
jgi:hypothetical protein